MDLHICNILRTLILLSILCINSRAQHSGSVFFLDSPSHQFLRSRPSDIVSETLVDAIVGMKSMPCSYIDQRGSELRSYCKLLRSTDIQETNSMLLPEVGAAVSVLLGFAPPATLSSVSSSKLNAVLMPNPFNRPHAIFILEIEGAEDSQLAVDANNLVFSKAIRTRIIRSSNKVDVQIPDRKEVSIISLDKVLRLDSDEDITDQQIIDLALLMGGSYVSDTLKTLSGELTIPLANGVSSKLHMSKQAERKYITSLVSLIHNIRSVIQMHEAFTNQFQAPAELLTGTFDGIKALQDEYGPEGVTQQGIEILFTAMSKIFNSLQAAYKGELVGVILCNEKPSPESESMLNVIFHSHPSSRFLVEASESTNPSSNVVLKVLLVRRTLAWLTGIILLIATFLGTYFLLNMPLTRDSLLYSNVKLD